MKINWRMVAHLIFLTTMGAALWGSFEHNLQLQYYKRMFENPDWHWFWGTQITWLPHHQWIGLFGLFVGYIFLSKSDYIVERLIYHITELEKRVKDVG